MTLAYLSSVHACQRSFSVTACFDSQVSDRCPWATCSDVQKMGLLKVNLSVCQKSSAASNLLTSIIVKPHHYRTLLDSVHVLSYKVEIGEERLPTLPDRNKVPMIDAFLQECLR